MSLRDLAARLSPWFWGLSAGVIGLYVFGLIMGAFTPGEIWGWTILVAILAVLSIWHAARVRRAMSERNPELMRAEGKARETRGF